MVDTLPGAFTGMLFGVTHAVEPDHLAAVSTIVTEARSPWRGAIVGAAWGLGHTVALVVVGIVLATVEATLPPLAEQIFEFLVAAMLILLGLRGVRRAYQLGTRGPTLAHAHGQVVHAHATSGEHIHVGRWTLARRPFIVGLVHGLAGSGSLTAMVLAGLPTPGARVGYIALFGLGSMVGMAALSGLAGWPLSRLARRPRAIGWLSGTTGAVSAGLGIYWACPLLAAWIG